MSKIRLPFWPKPLLPEDVYYASIHEMEWVENQKGQNMIRITFQIMDELSRGQPLYRPRLHLDFTPSLHPRSNLVSNLVIPVLGEVPGAAYCDNGDFRLDRLIGEEVHIEVTHVEMKDDTKSAVISKVYGKKGKGA